MSDLMPGPTSDSYDPEFGTSSNAQDVEDGIQAAIDKIGTILGPDLKNIVDVAQNMKGPGILGALTERDLRCLRFAAIRSLESV